jgi:hypothetical protein
MAAAQCVNIIQKKKQKEILNETRIKRRKRRLNFIARDNKTHVHRITQFFKKMKNKKTTAKKMRRRNPPQLNPP